MKVSYYPGCSLEHSAKDYEESIEAVADLLDVQLEEVPDWNCCGATAAHSINENLALALPARNLVHAEAQGHDVVVPCALCFNRLKVAEHALLGPDAATLGLDYQGKIKVWDLLDYLTQEPILGQINDKLKKPLGGSRLCAALAQGTWLNRASKGREARRAAGQGCLRRDVRSRSGRLRPDANARGTAGFARRPSSREVWNPSRVPRSATPECLMAARSAAVDGTFPPKTPLAQGRNSRAAAFSRPSNRDSP